jgi:porin
MKPNTSLLSVTTRGWIFALSCLGVTAPALADTDSSRQASCRDYDSFITRGSESPIISTCETISPELFGIRRAMYERGWLFRWSYGASETYDVRGQEARPQMYNGQRPSYSGSLGTILTYDLTRLGWFGPKAQFTLEVNSWRNTYAGAGINDDLAFAQLSVEQRFANERVRLQYGYYAMIGQFYGMFLGTSTASSALGPTSIIPSAVGMSYYKPSPSFDIRLYSKSGRFYDHFGMSRSQSPDGFLADSEDNNSGLKWSVDGAKPIYVNEIGYRVYATANSRMTWLRQGTIYNRSSYFDYDLEKDQPINRGFYLVADHQFTQPDPDLPHRGWYFNLKTNYAQPERVTYTADYSGTLYSLAPFASRPGDMFSLGYTYNKVSKYAQSYRKGQGLDPVNFSSTTSVSYAARVARGLYWVNSLSHTRNPVITERYPDALNLQSKLTFSF